MNRLDLLYDVRAKGEGILSASLAPDGARDYSALFERVDMLKSAGLNQLLEIVVDPQAFKGADIANTETALVLEGMQKGSHFDMFHETIIALRNRYPDLPLIASGGITDMLCYGQQRFLTKCAKIGVDGIDFPLYLAAEDPIGFRQGVINAGMYYVAPINAASVDFSDPYIMDLLEKLIVISAGQIFLVPAPPGTGNGFDGKQFQATVECIREIQYKHNVKATIISIGGITRPDDAYQLVKVAGTDGVHFSSALIQKLLGGVPLEKIEDWLKEVKAAMTA